MRVLLLSYAFPPMALPEAALSAKRLGNLGADVEVDVLCAPAFRPFMGDDHSLDPYVEERFHTVTRLAVPGPMRWLPFGRMAPLVERPDFLRLLNRRLLAAVLEATSAQRYDAVVSWSQWHSVHLAALALKRRRPGLRWVAHLSDPWVDNPYQSFGRRRAAMLRAERAVVGTADAISVTNDETAELLARGDQSVAARTTVLPHAFEPALYPASTAPSGPVVLRHLGQLYGLRTPAPLFDALRRLQHDRPGLLDDVRIELVGRVAPEMASAEALDGLPPGLVTLVPSVPYVESLALMSSADGLVAIDAPAARNVFLPSKVVDYLGARRPILAITPPGPTHRLVVATAGYVAAPERPADIAVAVAGLLERIRGDRGALVDAPEVLHEHQADVVGGRMRALLEGASR